MITKCLFPAAGYGTRFLPATKAVPKEMLPILTKPLLQYGVEEAISAGINNMAIVTGRGKRSIEDHFDNSLELESQLKGTSKEFYLDEIREVIEHATFTYVRQQRMLGLGHAILTGMPLIGNEPFAVILADDFFDCPDKGVMSQLIDIYTKYKCSIIAIEEIPSTQVEKYGIISGKLIDNSDNIYQVSSMLEKPNLSDLSNFNGINLDRQNSFMGITGRYILTPDIFDILREIKPGRNGEIQITDALDIQAKSGKVIALKYKGNRFDCGSIDGYVNATISMAKKRNIVF